MRKYKKIVFIYILFALSASVSAATLDIPGGNFFLSERQEKVMAVDIMINGVGKVQLKDIPVATTHLEVFSILGVRVARINLREYSGLCFIDLPKGLYILKAGNVAQKIIVK